MATMLAQVTKAKTLFPKMAAIAVTWALQRMPPQARGGRSSLHGEARGTDFLRSFRTQSVGVAAAAAASCA